jgi:hypothetical protein
MTQNVSTVSTFLSNPYPVRDTAVDKDVYTLSTVSTVLDSFLPDGDGAEIEIEFEYTLEDDEVS